MLELEVDGTLGCGERHVDAVALERNLLNLRDVLAHEPIEERLRVGGPTQTTAV